MSPTHSSVLRIVCFVGLVSLLHCACSAAQHRFYLRLTEQPFTHLPLDIVVQTIVSLIALVYSTSFISGDFQPIRTDLQNRSKSWDTLGNCPSFYTFDHRAKTLSPSYSAHHSELIQFIELSHSFFKQNVRLVHCKPTQVNSENDICNKSGDGKLNVKNARRIDPNIVRQSLTECINQNRKRDYCNYVATLLMPSSIQSAAFTLLAFNIEIATVRDQIARNSGTAGIYRLQFWKDTLGILYGRGRGPVPRQPVAICLATMIHRFDESKMEILISARQRTLGDHPFKSLDDIEQYGSEVHGTLLIILMNLLQQNHQNKLTAEQVTLPAEAVKIAHDLGKALWIATLIRSVVPMLCRGIFVLPENLMQTYNLSYEDFYSSTNSLSVRSLVQDLIETASSLLQGSRQTETAIPHHLRPALMASCLQLDHIISIIRRFNYGLSDAKLQRSPELVAWRLWWKKIRAKY